MSKGKRMASRAEMKKNKKRRRQAKKDGKLLRASNKRNRRYAPKRTTPKTSANSSKSRKRTNTQRTTPRTSTTTNKTRKRSNTERATYGYSYYQQRRRKRKINKFRVFMALLILIAIIATPIYLIKKNIKQKQIKEEKPQAIASETPEETAEVTPEVTPSEPSPIQEESPQPIEGKEDEKIKELIQKTISENKLKQEQFAFFYYNTNTKEYYFYNEDQYMTGGSVVKMPIGMLYYDMLNAGEISLDDKIEYKQDAYEAGAGATASMYKVGESVPIKYLIEQSIINSDNTATNILISKMGHDEYRKAITQYTTIKDLPEEFYENNIISARYGYDVCKYLYDNKIDYEGLIEILKKSSNGSYLKKYLKNTDVAHKYGSYEGYEHDYGIVFGKNTYLVGIFTNGVKDSEEFISKLSLNIFNIEEAE